MAEPRVVVVGAGPAGGRAAARLVEAGLRPVVIDEAAAGGGQIYRRQPRNFGRAAKALYGFEAKKAKAVHAAFDALLPRIDYRPETLAWNIYDGAVHLLHGARSSALPFDALILAPGATDRVIPLPGWTLPGVYSLGGAQIALKAQACAIGARCVFLGTGPLLYLVAYQYAKAGAKVSAVLDSSAFSRRLAALPALAARPDTLAKGMYYSAWLAMRDPGAYRGHAAGDRRQGPSDHCAGARCAGAGATLRMRCRGAWLRPAIGNTTGRPCTLRFHL